MAGEVEFVGGPEAEAALAKLAELVADLRPFWPLVIPIFIRWMGKQFDEQGSYFGEQWAPLTEAYEAWKMVHYPGKNILSADGDLRRAATTPKRRAFPEMLVLSIPPFQHRQTANAAARTIDPDWFQSGTERMVARPLLSEIIPAEGQAELDEAASMYIRENALRLGLAAP